MEGKDSPFEKDLDRVYNKYVRSALSIRNKEYGDYNLLAYGEFGILVRLSDKLSRLDNEVAKDLSTKESKKARREVWRDIAGYALQALRIVDETLGNLPEEK
jgi:hypothetical protein